MIRGRRGGLYGFRRIVFVRPTRRHFRVTRAMFSVMRRRRRGMMMIMMMIIIAGLVMVMVTTTRIFTVHSGVRRRVGLLLDDVAAVREEVVAHARRCVAVVAVAVRLAAVVVEARTC